MFEEMGDYAWISGSGTLNGPWLSSHGPWLKKKKLQYKIYITKHFWDLGTKGISRIGTSNFISKQGWCHITDIGALNIGHQQLVMVPTLAGCSDIGRTVSWQWQKCP